MAWRRGKLGPNTASGVNRCNTVAEFGPAVPSLRLADNILQQALLGVPIVTLEDGDCWQ